MTQIISQAELDALVQTATPFKCRNIARTAVYLSAEAVWESNMTTHPAHAGYVSFYNTGVILDGDFTVEELQLIIDIEKQIQALQLPE